MSYGQRGKPKPSRILIVALALLVSGSDAQEPGGPVASETDGKIGAFRQHNAGDCFFLVSVLALVNDPDGRRLVEDSFAENSDVATVKVVFPNRPDLPVVVSRTDLLEHKLFESRGRQRLGRLVSGDPDMQMMEVAADRLWTQKKIKKEGLWDDVPMNAFAMFSSASQKLIWNRSKASSVAINDVEKYKRLPTDSVIEIQADTAESAEELIKTIVSSDRDGISMALLDYRRYHGLAIIDFDFEGRTYTYLDPLRGTEKELTGDLQILLDGISQGKYAINYIEIPASGVAK